MLFAGLALLGASFEVFTFEGRTSTLLKVDLLFAIVIAAGFWWIRHRPELSVEVMTVCVAIAGAGIAIYHGFEGASAEACLLVMTALLSSATLFFPWGWRTQLAASSGVALGFPLALMAMPAAMSTVANMSFLPPWCGLSWYAAAMNRRQFSRDYYLARGAAPARSAPPQLSRTSADRRRRARSRRPLGRGERRPGEAGRPWPSRALDAEAGATSSIPRSTRGVSLRRSARSASARAPSTAAFASAMRHASTPASGSRCFHDDGRAPRRSRSHGPRRQRPEALPRRSCRWRGTSPRRPTEARASFSRT